MSSRAEGIGGAGDSSPEGYKTQVFWEKIAKNRLILPQRKLGLAFLPTQRPWDYRHAQDSVRIAPPRVHWRHFAGTRMARGSGPPSGHPNLIDQIPRLRENLMFALFGGVPERSKGADCKSVGSAFGGSNPPPSTRWSPVGFTVANGDAPVQSERGFIRRLKCSERV